MRHHHNPALRCPRCRLHLTVCLCDSLPTLPTQTRVVLLLHQLEANKTTNTGRFALRCLPNSELALRGRDATAPRARPGDPPAASTDPARADAPPPWLTRAARPVLLFPHPEAHPLHTFVGTPVTLIVPDGTWSQAVRARKRIPGLAAVPCAALPTHFVSTYRLRHDARPGHLSTLEAIARALGILESPAAEEALLTVHRRAVERTLWTKGHLAANELSEGLPLAALVSRQAAPPAKRLADQDETNRRRIEDE